MSPARARLVSLPVGTALPHPCREVSTPALLAAHVSLTLLLDLWDPSGPQSRDLLQAEPGSADWLLPSPASPQPNRRAPATSHPTLAVIRSAPSGAPS